MLRKLLSYFSRGTEAAASLYRPTPPAPKVPMTDDELAAAIALFYKVGWFLKDATRGEWLPIKPVDVAQPFGGWAFVQGKNEALRINSRVYITEAGDDMDYSEYCVLVDYVPCLLILLKSGAIHVTIVAERDFLAEVFNTAAMRCTSVEEFKQMPQPVQKIMRDVFEKVAQIHAKRTAGTDAVEKMLSY